MKILVVCVPRSGTTSFLNSLKSVTRFPLIALPDSYTYTKNSSLIGNALKLENLIMRVVPSQHVGMPLVEFSKLFDVTILMSRRNDKEHMESYINAHYRKFVLNKVISNSSFNNDTEYDFSTIPSEYIKQFNESSVWEQVIRNKEEVLLLSRLLEKSIMYYEDLYYSTNKLSYIKSFFGKTDINFTELISILNSTKKLRKTSTKSLI